MKRLMIACACGVLGLGGCGGGGDAGASDGSSLPVVLTTFEPTRSMCERIGGDLFDIGCVLPEDADPVHWTPGPEVIAELQDADLIVLNGAGMEKWAATAPLPESKVVETAKGIELIETGEVTHSHGPGGAHTHGKYDPHTWVDPENAAQQAAGIRDALIELRPGDAEQIGMRYAALAADLVALSERLRALTPRLEGAQILCSHPAYNYLARRFGWKITNIDIDPATPLTQEQTAALQDLVVSSDPGGDVRLRVMLWESEPLAETAAALKGLGITGIVYSPAESPSDEGGFVERQAANVSRLEAVVP